MDDNSIDSDEREFIENISWDTESDDEDLIHDEEVINIISGKGDHDPVVDRLHSQASEE